MRVPDSMNSQPSREWRLFEEGDPAITLCAAPRHVRRHFNKWAHPVHQQYARLQPAWKDFYSDLWHTQDMGYITDIERNDILLLVTRLWRNKYGTQR